MGSKVEYVDSSQIYATNYARNSKAIGVLWGIFTICHAIIITVAFITPEWIGESSQSENPARFGLWNTCYFDTNSGGIEECQGTLNEVLSFSLPAFNIAAIFGLMSVSMALLTVLTLTLFFFCTSTKVYRISGCLQLFSAVFLMTTIIVYPLGWSSPRVKQTCNSHADSFYPGDCNLRWAYFLAITGCLDAVVLSILAFILASRHIKLQPEPLYSVNGSLLKGESNNGYICDTGSTTGSRKSLNLHPVLLMPQPMTEIDRFSELSTRTSRSKTPFYSSNFNSGMQNFQL